MKLLEILNELFYQQLLKSDNQAKRVVNIFADQLVKTPDKRVANICLNFLLNDDSDDEESEPSEQEVDENGDGPTDPTKQDDLNKLYAQLKQTLQAFRLDEVKRRKEVEKIQSKIRKIKFAKEFKDQKKRIQLKTLDYIRFPPQLVDQLIAKFLAKPCQFHLRLRIFQLISKLTDLYQLLTPNLFTHFAKYMRPSQENVSELMEYLIQCVNVNQ